MNGLKKQARQATRYRNLSDLIRTAEATLFYLRWTTAEADLEKYRVRLSEVEAEVNRLSVVVGVGWHRSKLKPLRIFLPFAKLKSARAAVLQRLVIARDGLDEEEERIEAQVADTQHRIEETIADSSREQTLISDAEAAHSAPFRRARRNRKLHVRVKKKNRAKAAIDLSTAAEAVEAYEGSPLNINRACCQYRSAQ